ncbi:MAG: B12-binding domain-containing radical SAM protein, partial [Candidatus Scalindua sp.]|nr:B12-binding domain-containing radical SAM protein [Candidatus Scalindua sp.]
MRVLLIAYDHDAYTTWFPHGLAYIAAVLRKAGHEVSVYSQDQYHWPESHLKKFLIEKEPE